MEEHVNTFIPYDCRKISKGDDIILKLQLFYLLGQENLYILVHILNILPMNILFSNIDNRAQISKKKSIILYLTLFS